MNRPIDVFASNSLPNHPSAPTESPAEPANGGAAGAQPSNTAPANTLGDDFRPLGSGIDSLYLSYTGDIRPDWESRLREAKVSAQSPEERDRLQAQIPFGSHLFQVKDKGRGRFAYTMQDNWFDVALSSRTARLLPA